MARINWTGQGTLVSNQRKGGARGFPGSLLVGVGGLDFYKGEGRGERGR